MPLYKFARFATALIVAACITGPCAALALLSAIFRTPWLKAPVSWGRYVTSAACTLADITITYSGRHWKPSHAGVPILVIANHPPQVGFPFLYDSIYRFTGRQVVKVVAKDTLNPVFRWPLQALGLVTCIRREDRESSLERLSSTVVGEEDVLLLFPDQSRYSQGAVNEQREKYKDAVPAIDELLRYVLVPKTGGLLAILRQLPDNALVIDLTLAISTSAWSDAASINWADSTLYVHGDYFRVHELPLDEPCLRDWLVSRWRKKARRIASLRAAKRPQDTSSIDS